MIGKFIGGLFGKVVDNAEGILDKVITTDKERDEAKLALRKLLLEAETEAFNKEVEDRKLVVLTGDNPRRINFYLSALPNHRISYSMLDFPVRG